MRHRLALWFAVSAALVAAGCGADNPGCPSGMRCGTDGGIDAPADMGNVPNDTAIDAVPVNPRDVTAVEIDPANATITATNGMPVMQAYRAMGVRADGTRVMLMSGAWSTDHVRLGTISQSDGVFTANGLAAGEVRIQVEAPGAGGAVLRASTTLTVRMRREVIAPGAPMLAPARFAESTARVDAMRAARVLYPLHDALMPSNVPAPTVQWDRGTMNDLYRVRIAKPNVTVTAYVLHSGAGFNFAYRPDPQLWQAVLETDPEAPAVVSVDRWDASTMEVVTGAPVRVRFTRGAVFGQVYYWNLAAGRMQRIHAVTGANTNVVPNPPERTRDRTRCVACHTVSRNGRYLAASVTAPSGADFTGSIYDLTADLTPNPTPTAFPTAASYACSTFNPDATRLLVCATNNWAGPFRVIDPRTGMFVPADGLPTMGATQPEWSPDGANVAFVANTTVGADGFPTAGDLALLPVVDTMPLMFATPRVIHRGADLAMGVPVGRTDSHPTWSPDSRLIAFQHGVGAFSVNGPGALYLISRDGGTPARLDNANGGAGGVETYWPTFSPFVSNEPGGRRIFWLAYFSRVDYGNAQAGTRGTRRRQLWVTAIDPAAAPGTDPSSVPYWLPGQDVATENMAAYWAQEPCRMNGADCSASSECCSGNCRPDPMNAMRLTCQPPPPTECRRRGQTCGSDGDCCMGLRCLGNVCDLPPG